MRRNIAVLLLATVVAAQDADVKAVKVSLDKGLAAMRAGETDKGIAYLEQVVKAKPRIARFRLLLGASYLQAKRNGEAWRQIRLAAKWAPQDRQAQQLFNRLWSVFDRAGLLNSGAPVAALKKTAGEPDKQSRERLLYGPMSVEFRGSAVHRVVDTRGLRGPVPAAKRIWHTDVDVTTWRIGHRAANRSSDIVEWVQRGDIVQRAPAMFSTQRLLGAVARGGTAKSLMTRIHAGLKRMYPTLEWKTIKDGEDDVVFEWRVPAAHGRPPQHEIARLSTGKVDVHRIAYVARKKSMTKTERAQWLKSISNARLVDAR